MCTGVVRLVSRKYLEGPRLQCVAGEAGHRFSENNVAGGPAAAEVIIVHRRQIVVNQRIGVNDLDRSGGSIQPSSAAPSAQPVA
jgi:hypothetical protein